MDDDGQPLSHGANDLLTEELEYDHTQYPVKPSDLLQKHYRCMSTRVRGRQ